MFCCSSLGFIRNLFGLDDIRADHASAVNRPHDAPALGVAARNAHFGSTRADEVAGFGNPHEFVTVVHDHRADQTAGLVL